MKGMGMDIELLSIYVWCLVCTVWYVKGKEMVAYVVVMVMGIGMVC